MSVKTTIKFTLKDMTTREKAQAAGLSGAKKMESVLGKEIKVINAVELSVINDRLPDGPKEYPVYLFFTDNGTFQTSSKSLWEAFMTIRDIYTECGEDVSEATLRAIACKSKNNLGDFYSIEVV